MHIFKGGWKWVPSLYFAEGLPYVIVITMSVIMYKNLGISNAEIAFYTSWFYLPWVVKPFWSPFVDLLKTKRWWIVVMQSLLGVGFASVAFLIPASFFFQSTLAVFWIMAFCSATHDIAADGFYMMAQNEADQSFFVGVRNIFYRVAMVTGQGFLVMLAGMLSRYMNDVQKAWSIVFLIVAGLMLAMAIYHYFVLPRPKDDDAKTLSRFGDLFVSYFRRKGIVAALLFILLYRLGEAQLSKIAVPFLLDNVSSGGLGMSTEDVGFVYGTVGVVFLLIGGLAGGFVAARDGLRKWLWPMVFAMNVPNVVYVFLALAQPSSFAVVCSCVAVEQLGYGFGFTAFTLYLIWFVRGEYQTAHYAICTGFMALGMMLPGMVSGFIEECLGYSSFFVYVIICCLPGMFVVKFLDVDDGSKSVEG